MVYFVGQESDCYVSRSVELSNGLYKPLSLKKVEKGGHKIYIYIYIFVKLGYYYIINGVKALVEK